MKYDNGIWAELALLGTVLAVINAVDFALVKFDDLERSPVDLLPALTATLRKAMWHGQVGGLTRLNVIYDIIIVVLATWPLAITGSLLVALGYAGRLTLISGATIIIAIFIGYAVLIQLIAFIGIMPADDNARWFGGLLSALSAASERSGLGLKIAAAVMYRYFETFGWPLFLQSCLVSWYFGRRWRNKIADAF